VRKIKGSTYKDVHLALKIYFALSAKKKARLMPFLVSHINWKS
jgi:hypothetical protein